MYAMSKKASSTKHWFFIIALIVAISPSLLLLQNGEVVKGILEIGSFIISILILAVFFMPLALLWRFIKHKTRGSK